MLLSAKSFSYSDNARIRRLNPKLYTLYDWVSMLVITLISALLIITFGVTTVTVDGESMEPTLQNGQRLFIMTIPFNIQKGDIVVVAQDKVDHPEAVEPLIKRVIATEGDTVDIDFTAGIVYVNGEALDEPYVKEAIHSVAADPMNFPLVVEKDCIFVLGDNRNNSRDSRAQSVGQINKGYVYGKVFFRYYPVDDLGPIKNPYKQKEE